MVGSVLNETVSIAVLGLGLQLGRLRWCTQFLSLTRLRLGSLLLGRSLRRGGLLYIFLGGGLFVCAHIAKPSIIIVAMVELFLG